MKQQKKFDTKVFVAGDTIIDKHVYLTASGLSLESPTMKTNYNREIVSYGGAANVAKHLSLLCGDVTFFTSFGSESLLKAFKKKYNINVINKQAAAPNMKTRYWIERGDSTYKYLQVNDTNSEIEAYDVGAMDFQYYNVVAISDYRCGLIQENLINYTKGHVSNYAASQVSSKKNNFEKFSGFRNFVMNRSEAELYCKEMGDLITYQHFQNLNTEAVYVTAGSDGCFVYNENMDLRYLPSPKKVKNTIGAGDAFYAGLLASSGDVDFANRWAGYYVSTDIGCNHTLEGFNEHELQTNMRRA